MQQKSARPEEIAAVSLVFLLKTVFLAYKLKIFLQTYWHKV